MRHGTATNYIYKRLGMLTALDLNPDARAGYLAHGTATDYMYERLGVPLSFTWEIYGDTKAHFNDCFRMFNPVTQTQFDEARSTCLALPGLMASMALLHCLGRCDNFARRASAVFCSQKESRVHWPQSHLLPVDAIDLCPCLHVCCRGCMCLAIYAGDGIHRVVAVLG